MLKLVIFTTLLLISVTSVSAYDYRCDSKAMECDKRCLQNSASMECLGKCNDEYNLCRDLEERAMREDARRQEIVPPSVWTRDGVKPAW